VHVANTFGTTAMIAGNLAVYKELLEETSQAGQTEAQT
jgi:hypothetical protein